MLIHVRTVRCALRIANVIWPVRSVGCQDVRQKHHSGAQNLSLATTLHRVCVLRIAHCTTHFGC